MDIPDLPLVLQLLAARDSNRAYPFAMDDLIERYCLERGISPNYLSSYVNALNRYYENAFQPYSNVDFIGFSVGTSNLLSTFLAAHHLKQRKQSPFIVAGGPQLTESPATTNVSLSTSLNRATSSATGYLVSTKSQSAWIYALLVDSEELGKLQELALDMKRRGPDYPPVAECLRDLESRQIAFPSLKAPPVAQFRFSRQLPEEDVVVALSPFVVVRSMDQEKSRRSWSSTTLMGGSTGDQVMNAHCWMS